MGINSVGTESVYQTGQAGRSECLAGRPYSRNTRKTQLSPSSLTLHIPVICKAHASFRGMLSQELPVKSLQSSVAWIFTLSLSNTQPLQWNPTIHTRYKRLNNITIKFGTEYKPTKHNVVNNNFIKIKYFIKIISLPSIKILKFYLILIILMRCLYYFKWSAKKIEYFDVGCIVKWGNKNRSNSFLRC